MRKIGAEITRFRQKKILPLISALKKSVKRVGKNFPLCFPHRDKNHLRRNLRSFTLFMIIKIKFNKFSFKT